MNARTLGICAALGSLAMMLGALGFQYLGDLPPCKMCYWQRYPHIAAIGIGAIFYLTSLRFLLLLGGLSALTTALIGVYHVDELIAQHYHRRSGCDSAVSLVY